MNLSRLERAVEQYEAALIALEKALAHQDLPPEERLYKVLDVLVIRDAVQVALKKKNYATRSSLIKVVTELDNRLREQAEYTDLVHKLSDWRTILNPPTESWWWFFDLSKPLPWWDHYDWLWKALSLAFLTASLSLLVDICTRFISGGPDTAGAFAIIVPSILTLLSRRANINVKCF